VRRQQRRERVGGEDEGAGVDAELCDQRCLDPSRQHRRCDARRCGEHRIAAVQHGVHVGATQALEQRAQVTHRDPLGASDVDPAQQGDPGRARAAGHGSGFS
jgi:hypothetical protein